METIKASEQNQLMQKWYGYFQMFFFQFISVYLYKQKMDIQNTVKKCKNAMLPFPNETLIMLFTKF